MSVHFIVVTWAQVICQKCMPKVRERSPKTAGIHFWQITSVHVTANLIQNSQAVKKECGPEKGYGEKRCEIQGGGQEMAVMVG